MIPLQCWFTTSHDEALKLAGGYLGRETNKGGETDRQTDRNRERLTERERERER